jgi:hypothetical protein
MPATDRMTVWIGGPAGVEELFLCACARAGIAGVAEPVEADAGIRCVVRAGGAGGTDNVPGCDVLVALDEETLAWSAAARRLVLYDARILPEPPKLQPGVAALALPAADAATAAAAMAWLAGLELEVLTAAWARRLRGEAAESAALKIQAARRAYESAAVQLGPAPFLLPRAEGRLALVSGAQALGLGALAAGCTCLSVPDSGRGRGPAAWLLGAAARGGPASAPAADEASAVALAAGSAIAGARALADLTAASLAAAGEMLRFCAEAGLPVVVLARDDGWRWPRGLPVAELRPADAGAACLLAAQAFNLAETHGVPAVVWAGPGLLGRWEALPLPPLDIPIERGSWASGPQAGPEARAVPGQDAPLRFAAPLTADELTQRRAALEDGPPPPSPATSPLFPVPAAATLEEREPRPPEDFLPAGDLPAPLRLLARAWSGQGLQPKDVFVAAGGSCGLPAPAVPRTYGALVPAGFAAAAAAGVKLANPALAVAALDDGAAVFSRGLAQLLHAARGNHDLLVLLREGAAPVPVDLLGLAGQAGATFLARLPGADEEAGAGVLAQALAHKGLALVACPCGAVEDGTAAAGVLHEQAGAPAFEETEPSLAAYGAPVGMALDLRPRLCGRLAEELV